MKIELEENGCPCGNDILTLAKDKIEYTTVEKTKDGWAYGGVFVEDMDSDDPLGNVRLFCPECGEYFNVPEELF